MSDLQIAKLKKEVSPYEQVHVKTSIRQLINTLGPMILFWCAAYFSLQVSYLLTLLFAVITSGFIVRTFIIFHDCCHGSFFKSKKLNDVFGIITGVLTLFPYLQWKNEHNIHHATSSNLDKRGVGDIWVLTVDEYVEATFWKRLAYRTYRNPFVMFGIGPIATFLIQYRFNRKGAKRKERMNTYLMNILMVLFYGALALLVGWQELLLVHLPAFYVAGAMGIWLFYVQHQFEDTYFEKNEEWSYVLAAVEGSSYYKLPPLLQWLTGNIGFHHVHHLSPRVPNYLLEQAHTAVPPLQKATTITIKESFASLRYRLWDEKAKRFVSFKDIRHLLLSDRKVVDTIKTIPGAKAKVKPQE